MIQDEGNYMLSDFKEEQELSKGSYLSGVFRNCLDRGCTPEQLQCFVDRARIYNIDRLDILALIDDLEVRYITSLNLPEGVETC